MMLKVISEFAPARDSVSWAEDAITDFKGSSEVFFQGDVAEIVTEFDANSGEHVQKLRFRKSLPRELRRRATEALTNTRHAFDQATFASRNLTTGVSRKSIYFPWAANPVDLKRLLERRGIDQRLWDTFSAHEPYGRSDTHTGGDDLIRALATLANRKHTLGLAVQGHISSTGFPNIRGEAAQELSVLSPRWDPVKNEADLIRWIGDVEVNGNYQFRFEIVLEDTGLPKPVNAIASLSTFHAKAKAVIEDLQARCLEILS